MGIWGQDWSSYQSATPPTNGLSFAFVKITEGQSYVNPNWTSQRDDAKAGGLVWGGYHYPHMTNNVQAEANYFLSKVNWKPGDLVVLDWEGYDAVNSGVSKANKAKYKDAWLKYVKSKLPHNPVGMYCNTDYWLNVDKSSYYCDFLWIATAGRSAGDPGIKAPWLFHQYSSSGTDKDYCHLASTAALRDWAMSFQLAPAPTPKPTPTPIPAPKYLLEEDVPAYFPPIPANTTVTLPVEPAGTLAKPQGGASNGPIWLCLAPQGGNATVTLTLHQGGKEVAGKPFTIAAGSKYTTGLPTDGSVDVVSVHSTAPLIGYTVGRQVA